MILPYLFHIKKKIRFKSLDEELVKLRIWLSGNKLSLHLGKTECILFGSKVRLSKVSTLQLELGGKPTTTSVNYLGCILDGNLGGESMALKVLGKVNARTRYLARKAKLLDRDCLKVLASSLVQCHLNYAICSWFGGLSRALKQKLQVSQNNLIRVVLGLDYRSHVGRTQFQQLQWLPVEARAGLLQLNMVHKIIYGRAPKYFTNYFMKGEGHGHNTRESIANLSLQG